MNIRLSTLVPLSLLSLAALTTVQVGSVIAQGLQSPPGEPATRLAASIQDEQAAQKRTAADRARAIDLKEKLVKAAGKTAPPAATPVPDASDDPKNEKAADERILQLAKVYSEMKASDAGAVFETLDIQLQVEVAAVMRPNKFAKILSAMSPEKAKDLTTALARDAGVKLSPANSASPGLPKLQPLQPRPSSDASSQTPAN